jgi:hypothetical protein
MRFIERTGPGQLGLNYMWLPTFVGMNTALIQEIEASISPLFVGKALTEELLEEAHEQVIQALVAKFPSHAGLFDYLDGVKYVREDGGATG